MTRPDARRAWHHVPDLPALIDSAGVVLTRTAEVMAQAALVRCEVAATRAETERWLSRRAEP